MFDINGKLSNRPGERQVSVQHPPGNERIEKLQNSRLLQIHLPQSRYVPEHCRTPLLSATEDYLQVIRILAEELGQETAADTALVLMGHGSGHFANSAYAAMDYMFKEQGFPHIFVGTVEAYPDVNTVLKQLAKTGCTKVLLNWGIPRHPRDVCGAYSKGNGPPAGLSLGTGHSAASINGAKPGIL